MLIQVYNVGDYWREGWKSILENQDVFEQIFVSISKSPKQEEDIALVRDCKLEKLHWIRQDENLTAVEHGKRLDRWVGSFHPEGHIFVLCHDDILLRDGLLKLKELDLDQNDAVFGPFRFFFQEGSRREITVHEFHREDGRPIDKETFIFLQDQQQFTYNVSGLVLPAELFAEYPLPWHLLRYGGFSECCHLIDPRIRHVYQTAVPAVKIRWHVASEGALMKPDDLLHDSLVYHLIATAVAEKPDLRKFQTRSVLFLIRQDPWKGICYFIKLQFRLSRLKYYYPAGWRIYGYMLQILAGKAGNLLKRIFHAR